MPTQALTDGVDHTVRVDDAEEAQYLTVVDVHNGLVVQRVRARNAQRAIFGGPSEQLIVCSADG